MEYYPATKKEWNDALCSKRDGPRDSQIEWSKSEKDKYPMLYHLYIVKSKNDIKELIDKTDTHRHIKTNLWLPKGK